MSYQPSGQSQYQMPQANREKSAKKNAWVIVVASLVAIACIGAIIGIVLGGRKDKKTQTDIASAGNGGGREEIPTSTPEMTDVPTKAPDDTPKPTLKPLPTTAPTDTPTPTVALYDVGSFNTMHANNVANNGNMIGGMDWKCWCDANGLHYQTGGGELILDSHGNISCINEVGPLSYTDGGKQESFWYLIDGKVNFAFKNGSGCYMLSEHADGEYEKMWVNDRGGFFVYDQSDGYCLAYWSIDDGWTNSVTVSYPEGVAISGNYIYYLKADGENTVLYRQDMRKFGSDEKDIMTFYGKRVERIAAEDQYVYFAGIDLSAKQPCFGVIDADIEEGEIWNYVDYSESQYISSINVAGGYFYLAISDSAEEEQAHINYSRTSELWQDSGLHTYTLAFETNPEVGAWIGDMCLCPEKGKMAMNYSDEWDDLYYREVDMP